MQQSTPKYLIFLLLSNEITFLSGIGYKSTNPKRVINKEKENRGIHHR